MPPAMFEPSRCRFHAAGCERPCVISWTKVCVSSAPSRSGVELVQINACRRGRPPSAGTAILELFVPELSSTSNETRSPSAPPRLKLKCWKFPGLLIEPEPIHLVMPPVYVHRKRES